MIRIRGPPMPIRDRPDRQEGTPRIRSVCLAGRSAHGHDSSDKPYCHEFATYDATRVRQLWGSVAGTRWEHFLVLAIKTGLRQGELLGLKWRDVDFAAGALQGRRQLQRDKTLAPTKGRRSRRLELGQLELASLREHRVRQDERRLHWGDAWEGQGLVFCTDRGRTLGWRDTYRDFRNIVRKAELEAIRFHDLRHTNATLLLEQGVHPKVVQERLGHSDIAVTLDIYSQVTPTMGLDAARRLDDLFGVAEEEGGGPHPEGSAGGPPGADERPDPGR